MPQRTPTWTDAHTWEIERLLAKLKAEEVGHQNFPLIQALETALLLLARLGSTGQYPYGKLDKDDEGELAVAIAVDIRSAVIRIEFGKPVAWLGLPSSHAKELGQRLLDGAKQLEARRA